MKREAFILLIDSIQVQMQIDDKTGDSIHSIGDGEINNNSFVFTTKLNQWALEALKLEFNDKFNNISWFVYETDFGKKCKELHIVENNGKKLELKDSGDLYDWLIKCQ